MTRTRQANWPLRIFWLAVLAAAGGYVVGGSLLQIREIEQAAAAAGESAPVVSLGDLIFVRAMEIVIAAWVFFLGASIGSFLNVVVYRLPRGMTLLGTSHCPRCKKPILFRDNVPVLGWLMLRGRCRSCELPISIRYPIVEAIAGLLFLILAFVELFSGADNLLRPSPWPDVGIVLFIAEPHWALVRLVCFHAFLLSVLLAGAAIRIDDQRLPRSLLLTAVAVGFFGPLVLPELHPPLRPDLMVGAAAGFVIGVLIDTVRRWSRKKVVDRSAIQRLDRGAINDNLPISTAVGLGIIGLFLGWQAALSIAAIAVVLEFFLVATLASANRGWTLRLDWSCLLIAVLLQLVFWWRLFSLSWWPGGNLSPLSIGGGLALIFVFALAIRVLVFARMKTE